MTGWQKNTESQRKLGILANVVWKHKKTFTRTKIISNLSAAADQLTPMDWISSLSDYIVYCIAFKEKRKKRTINNDEENRWSFCRMSTKLKKKVLSRKKKMHDGFMNVKATEDSLYWWVLLRSHLTADAMNFTASTTERIRVRQFLTFTSDTWPNIYRSYIFFSCFSLSISLYQ